MPHVIVKLWPGKSEKQKQQLADKIVQAVTSTLHYGDESVSVAMEEISSERWKSEVFERDIRHGTGKIYKQPGYTM